MITVLPTSAAQCAQDFEHSFRGIGVEISGGLVRDDDVRVGDDRAGDGDPLLLTAGELRRQMPRAIRKSNEIERCGDNLPAAAGGNGRQQQRKFDVLRGRQHRNEVESLENESDVLISPIRQLQTR